MVHRLGRRENEMGAIAELAMTCGEPQAFRHELLKRLDRLVGFDLASLHAFPRLGEGSLCVRGYDAPLVNERLLDYMLEFEPQEISAVEAERPMIDTEVIPRGRREQLSLYREQLWPHGVSVFTTLMWRNRHGAFGFHLARTGRGRKFRRQELHTLELVLPAMKLAESYLSACSRDSAPAVASSFEGWADDTKLSKGERRIAELVTRGLQNREIADLVGVSPLTVRNQLGSVFRKADVSNRAELAFVCATASSRENEMHAGVLPWSTLFRRKAQPPT